MMTPDSTDRPVPWFPSIMYHRVVDEVTARDPYALQISAQQFERQLAYLRDNGYQAVTSEQALATRDSGDSTARIVVLTFDDGYADFMTHALPLLRKYQYPAVVMLVSGRIGGWNTWDAERADPVRLMGAAEIREAASAGITFGSHGTTHRRLSALDAGEVAAEARVSKNTLEDLLGAPVRIFAYPHGDCTPLVRAAVRDAGYAAAFGNSERCHERFNLSRIDGARLGVGLRWRFHLSGAHFRLGERRRKIARWRTSPDEGNG
jgi:peptidoglycan/xylan/chitin deacetylase (PgdA/CDA1 family)